MSEHGHANAHESALHGDAVITPSAGISWIMWVFLAISLVVVCWQGMNVVTSSGHGKVWPASDSLTVKLPPYQP